MTTRNDKSSQNKGSSGKAKGHDSGNRLVSERTNGTDVPGFELDEQRPFGQNSAAAPQGGKPSNEQRPNEPTHIGRTQSTTNSQ